MTAILKRSRGATVDAIDFYCGFGGSAQGIRAAGADIKAAANHNALAIECHQKNFPDVDHYRADLVDPDSCCGFGHKVKFVGHKMKSRRSRHKQQRTHLNRRCLAVTSVVV